MENIRITKTQSAHFIVAELGAVIIDPVFLKEMGEPLKYNKDQFWYLAYTKDGIAGFIVHNADTILYAYVYPSHRRRGVLTELYNQLPEQPWKTVASNLSMPFFVMKKGFKIIKSYTTCHKLKKY